jgi:hypothetical protein
MSLHKTNFSPLDHGTRARRRDPLLVDIAKALCLLPVLAATWVVVMLRQCWCEAYRLAMSRDA